MKKNFRVILLACFVGLLVAGCGLGKMVPRYPEVSIKLDNENLENRGGQVAYQVKGTIPPKYMKKKATMTVTPTIEYNGQRIALAPIEGEVGHRDTAVVVGCPAVAVVVGPCAGRVHGESVVAFKVIRDGLRVCKESASQNRKDQEENLFHNYRVWLILQKERAKIHIFLYIGKKKGG